MKETYEPELLEAVLRDAEQFGATIEEAETIRGLVEKGYATPVVLPGGTGLCLTELGEAIFEGRVQ